MALKRNAPPDFSSLLRPCLFRTIIVLRNQEHTNYLLRPKKSTPTRPPCEPEVIKIDKKAILKTQGTLLVIKMHNASAQSSEIFVEFNIKIGVRIEN